MVLKQYSPLFLFIMIGVLLNNCSQKMDERKEFEGIITFTDTLYAIRHDLIDEKALNASRGHEFKYYYKDGSFKLVSSGTQASISLHQSGDTVTYHYSMDSDTLFYNSILEETRTLDSLYYNEFGELVQVMGGTSYTYRFNDDIHVDPDHFCNYKFAYYDQLYGLSASHYVEQLYQSAYFKIKRIAVQIERVDLNDSIFWVPKLPKKLLE